MTSLAKKSIATVFAGTVLAVGVATPASAQPQNGLVNVVVGDVTIAEDVNVAAVVGVAATVCDVVNVTNVNILAVLTDQDSRKRTICVTDDRDRVFVVQD
jgi:hypothetical protein